MKTSEERRSLRWEDREVGGRDVEVVLVGRAAPPPPSAELPTPADVLDLPGGLSLEAIPWSATAMRAERDAWVPCAELNALLREEAGT